MSADACEQAFASVIGDSVPLGLNGRDVRAGDAPLSAGRFAEKAQAGPAN